MTHRIECFFDCSSPWTYLAFEYLQRQVAPLDAVIEWKPILVGGVFNTVNPSVYAARENPVPCKAAYFRKDLQDWARNYGIAIGWPEVFPVNSVKAMRGALVARLCVGHVADDLLLHLEQALVLAHGLLV